MRITDNFTLEEMTRTNTGLENDPNSESLENLIKLSKLLQTIRDEYSKPIYVSSAYRSNAVNKKVGGVVNSDHLYGCAADIKSTDGRNDILWEIICHLKTTGKIKFRQLIWEYGTQFGPQWIHISINNKHNPYRDNQILFIGVKHIEKKV